MVVCFALCGTLAFAQARHSASLEQRNGNQVVASLSQGNVMAKPSVGYNASIFTKAEGDVLYYCDFSQGGEAWEAMELKNANADWLDGGVISIEKSHRQRGNYGKWVRFDSATVEYLGRRPLASTYPTLYRWYGNRMEQNLAENMDSNLCSSNNGWMFMEVFDQTGVPNGEAFNAAIYFDKLIDLQGAPMFDISFYQWYMKFYDTCFVDYSVDNGNKWWSYEINVTNVDVPVNGALSGVATYTMPYNAIVQSNEQTGNLKGKIRLRLRWYSNVPSRFAGYGYAWMIDDFKVIAGGESRMNAQPEYYTEGVYQLMPKGMELPLFWHSRIINAGSLRQQDITATIYNYKDGEEAQVVSSAMETRTLSKGGSITAYVDVKGRYANDETYGWSCAHGDVRHAVPGNADQVMNDEAGDYYVYAQVKMTPQLDDGTPGEQITHTFDTVYYQVVDEDENGNMVWGHDNGVLTGGRAYCYGFVTEGENDYITEASEHYMSNGYSVSLRYTTADNVPVDETGRPWVIKGVEYVPATDTFIRNGNATIVPTLSYDSCIPGNSESVIFNTIRTGAGEVEVSDESYGDKAEYLTPNFLWDATKGGGYLERGDYPVIYVEFPEQPELKPNTAFRVGYQLAGAGRFAVASSAPSYYYLYSNVAKDSIRYYAMNDTNRDGASRFASHTTRAGMLDNPYDVRIYDPEVSNSHWASYSYGYYPMIHLIIGPYEEKAKHGVDIQCSYEDDDMAFGKVTNEKGDEVCGVIDSVTEGSTVTYYFRAGKEGHIDSVYIDGELAWSNKILNDEFVNANNYVVISSDLEDYENDTLFFFGLSGIDGDHTIEAFFGAGRTVGINDFASRVSMKMQPNPATSQVRLSVEGVSGMVDCSLIDMSGRVVYNNMINAEVPQTISLSGLAKGAYFVRITNSTFSKVEKLIVR